MPTRTVFSTKSLTTAIEQVKSPAAFLYTTAIGREQTHTTVKFEIHNKGAKRIRTAFVGRQDPVRNILKDSFRVDEYAPPAIKIKVVNMAEAMFEQKFGTTPYDDQTTAAKKELADELIFLKEVAFRTKLWALSQLLTTGIYPMADGETGITYDSTWAQEILTGGNLWSSAAADIIGQMEQKKLDIQKETGIVIDTVIVSPDVAALLRQNDSIKETLASYHNASIVLDQTARGTDGGDLIMYIPSLNLQVYSYAEWTQLPDAQQDDNLLPAGTVVYLKKGSFTCHYGALALKPDRKADESVLFPVKEVVRKWTTDSTEDNELQLHSAPLIIPDDGKGWACVKVTD
ncbi:MAG: major capsid protein [Fusobacteriaceae bacterium]|jgi:hypothetical protein|nr:major capsid protein [Fusobacteriaceae bacterium]